MSTITHLKWPFHCDCKVVFSPGISSFTNQYLIAYPALFSCLLGKQPFPNHLWGNSFCFFWTKIRKRTQTLFSSKWDKYKYMTAKTLSRLLLKSQYFYQFNKGIFYNIHYFFNSDDLKKKKLTRKLSSLLLWGHFQMFLFLCHQPKLAPLSQHLLNLEEKHFY